MSNILIIEDNPNDLELLNYLFQSSDHHVSTARNGSQGLVSARHDRPDLIICDIQLPEQDGYQVVDQLKRQGGLDEIPLVAVTVLASMGDREKVMAAGFDGYIPKPIDPARFVAQIEGFLKPARPPSSRH